MFGNNFVKNDRVVTGAPTALLVATGNAGKIRELSQLLADAPLLLLGLRDIPAVEDVPETGSTFAENAALKATGYALQSRHWALADDSGLEVDALDGRPGVLSARYGGADTPYSRKIEQLLAEIAAADGESRKARFVCSMAVSDPVGKVIAESIGVCEGSIELAPSGTSGFGYDPVFVPDGYDRTFGELDDAIKQQISHRARASREIIRYLLDFMGLSLDQSNIRL